MTAFNAALNIIQRRKSAMQPPAPAPAPASHFPQKPAPAPAPVVAAPIPSGGFGFDDAFGAPTPAPAPATAAKSGFAPTAGGFDDDFFAQPPPAPQPSQPQPQPQLPVAGRGGVGMKSAAAVNQHFGSLAPSISNASAASAASVPGAPPRAAPINLDFLLGEAPPPAAPAAPLQPLSAFIAPAPSPGPDQTQLYGAAPAAPKHSPMPSFDQGIGQAGAAPFNAAFGGLSLGQPAAAAPHQTAAWKPIKASERAKIMGAYAKFEGQGGASQADMNGLAGKAGLPPQEQAALWSLCLPLSSAAGVGRLDRDAFLFAMVAVKTARTSQTAVPSRAINREEMRRIITPVEEQGAFAAAAALPMPAMQAQAPHAQAQAPAQVAAPARNDFFSPQPPVQAAKTDFFAAPPPVAPPHAKPSGFSAAAAGGFGDADPFAAPAPAPAPRAAQPPPPSQGFDMDPFGAPAFGAPAPAAAAAPASAAGFGNDYGFGAPPPTQVAAPGGFRDNGFGDDFAPMPALPSREQRVPVGSPETMRRQELMAGKAPATPPAQQPFAPPLFHDDSFDDGFGMPPPQPKIMSPGRGETSKAEDPTFSALVQMGFSPNVAHAAVERHGDNLEGAANFCAENADRYNRGGGVPQTQTQPAKPAVGGRLPPADPLLTTERVFEEDVFGVAPPMSPTGPSGHPRGPAQAPQLAAAGRNGTPSGGALPPLYVFVDKLNVEPGRGKHLDKPFVVVTIADPRDGSKLESMSTQPCLAAPSAE